MKRTFAIATLCGLAAGLVACHVVGIGKTRVAGKKDTGMKTYDLDNGMKVMVKETRGNPTVTLDLWINTGSMNEPGEINGVSHFLEHMLFKGTEKRGVGEIDRMIEGVGGRLNAGTSQDYTHFYVTVASQYFDIALDVLSDAIMNSSIEPVELEKERLVVLEEYRRKQDNPMGFLYDQALAESYERSPYKAPVIGTPETINATSREKMLDYYHRYYVPNNIALVVVGDVAADDVLPRIRQAFEPFTRRLETYEGRERVTERKAGVVQEFAKDVKESYLLYVFPAPGITNASDVHVMDLLLYILGEGRSSRLYRNVQEKKQLVSSIGNGYSTQKLEGMFVISATFSYEKLEQVKKAIEEEIETLRRKRVPASELAKAKRLLTNQYYFSNETNAGQAQTLGVYYTVSGGVEFEREYLQKVNRVSAGDIQRIVRAYLDPAKGNSFVVHPQGR